MKTIKRRGLLAKAGALLAVAALAFSASPSQAQTLPMPVSSNVTITKLEQDASPNTSTSGTELSSLPSAPVKDVSFAAYAVTLTEDPGTNAWQKEIVEMDLATALGKIGVNPTPARDLTGTTELAGKTNDSGVITWNDVPRGLYVVRETGTPANVVPAGDFLLAVPLTDPDNKDRWLTDIFVYPKNDLVEGAKTVKNASDYAVGNEVTWTINADIPQIRDNENKFLPTDRFEIWDTLKDAELSLAGADAAEKATKVQLTSPTGLTRDTDYTIDVEASEPAGEHTVKVVFKDTGREKLAVALSNDPQDTFVTVTIDTVVESVGVIENSAIVYPRAGDNSYEVDDTEAVVKYGNITLIKTGTNAELVKDAEFRVYLTAEAAKAKNLTKWSPDNEDGYLTTKENPDGLWETDENGKVVIGGLRYSDFFDGTQISGEENYLQYWLVETKTPEGYQLLAEPVSFTITSNDASKELKVTNPTNTNGFVLPLTGGTGTTLLTILGLGILALVIFMARFRRNADA